MKFCETTLDGAWVVEPDRIGDHRGFFARTYCTEEFARHGLEHDMVQANISGSIKAGTIRGLHYQIPPMTEAKYIRVIRGAIWDVIVDLRPWSPTYLGHFGVELNDENRLGIYVPPMFAHGHQTLTDDVEITYLVSRAYAPGFERGLRFDDPAFAIAWPRDVVEISEKDLGWPAFDETVIGRELEAAAPHDSH